jgi:tetrahydromethanopterin S-methyltransferase subunit G
MPIAARDAAMVSESCGLRICAPDQGNNARRCPADSPDAAEVERRELRCQRLEQALENHHGELMQLGRDIGRLTGQIQAAGGDGVGEAHAAA